jgi:hypothetical protein
MARGEESLRLELARCRARSPEELARIASPPAPTFLSPRRRRRLGLGGGGWTGSVESAAAADRPRE